MTINDLRKKRELSMYELAEFSQVPYSTVHALCTGKTDIRECRAKTVYQLSRTLRVPMEDLLAPPDSTNAFTLFRCQECHTVKRLTQLGYIEKRLTDNEIERLWEQKEFPKALYILSMVDYLSRINELPLCDKYDGIRQYKLKRPLFASGVLLVDIVSGSERSRKKSLSEAIPEFKRHNIIEAEVLQ